MWQLGIRRFFSLLIALTTMVLGLVGAYSYGDAYSQHRGFAAVLQIPRAGTGRLMNVNFYSRALHRRAYYLTYLPPGYKPSDHYPVLYLLHGMPGKPEVFINIANIDVRLDNQLSDGNVRPMIMVFPDGRIGGSVYSDPEWANTPSGAFESYVLDVVRDVDHRFSTLADRQDRVIGGFSAGAYGAINIALHHLPVFGSAEIWSGYFTQTRTGVFAHASAAALENNSPLDYVSRLHAALAADPLRVFMFVGRADEASRQIVPMAHALTTAGALTTYALYAGGHDWDVWYPRLNQMLILASHDFAASLVPAHRSHRRRGARVAVHRASAPPRPPRVAPAAPRAPPLATTSTRRLRLTGALLLALISAAAINLGFLLQHRGLTAQAGGGRWGLLGMLRNRTWLAGQALGWAGFAAQLVAVALAPLSIVQAFAAGGFAVSLPLAARLFGCRLTRGQLLAISVIAASLASLSIGLVDHTHLHAAALAWSSLVALAAAAAIGLAGGPAAQAIAAGVFYGVADAAVKAESIRLHARGIGALVSGWTALAAVGTFFGFLAFQTALRRGSAVNAISLMNVFAALAALAFGVFTFGEALGRAPSAMVVHLLAILLVLMSVPVLATGQQQIAGGGRPPEPQAPDTVSLGRRLTGGLVRSADVSAMAIVLLVSALAGLGLLYALRGLGPVGPRIGDALPLLALAHNDGQSLVLIAIAFLAAGAVFGYGLRRGDPVRRGLAALAPVLLVLLLASDASYALAHNIGLTGVLRDRSPGLGPWVEGLLFAAGAAISAVRVGAAAAWAQAARASRRAAPPPSASTSGARISSSLRL